MKVVLKRNTPDYREAQELFSQFKAKGTTYLTYDYTTKDYLIECNQEASTYSEVMRIVLSDIAQRFSDQLNTEEKDALVYADGAIKTLIDMGEIL